MSNRLYASVSKSTADPGDQPGERTDARRRTRAALAMILGLAVLLRLLSFHGYAGSDDGSYAELADSVVNGTFRVGEYVGPPVFPLRVGVFAPVAALYALFGHSEWTTIAYPFLVSLLKVLLAFYAGRLLFGTTAGLAAAALQAALPLASRSATILMADLPAAFWANVGVVLLLTGLRVESRNRKAALGALCGAALGISWLCKESVAFLAPFLAAAVVWEVRRSRAQAPLVMAFAAAAAAVVLTESLVYWRITGDFFHRLHEMHRNYEYSSTWFFAEGSRFGWEPGQYHVALAKRLFRDGPATLLTSSSFGGVTAAAALAVGYAAFQRRKAFAFVGAWYLWLLLAFNFGTSNLQSYQPLVLFDKYAYPLLFPSCLLTGGLLSVLLKDFAQRREQRRSERNFWGFALTAGIAVGCATATAENIWSGPKSGAERVAARSLSPRDPLYTDSRTLRVMEFFWSFPKQLAAVDFRGMGTHDIPPGAYVLVNKNKLRLLEGYYDYGVPAFCRDAPPHWIVISKGDGVVLYRTPIDDLARARVGPVLRPPATDAPTSEP